MESGGWTFVTSACDLIDKATLFVIFDTLVVNFLYYGSLAVG